MQCLRWLGVYSGGECQEGDRWDAIVQLYFVEIFHVPTKFHPPSECQHNVIFRCSSTKFWIALYISNTIL